MHRNAPMRCLLLVPLVAACSGGGATAPDAETSCVGDPRGEEFVSGMNKTGELGITFTLVQSVPAPPGRPNNTWTVDVADASGPLAGADVSIKSWMPDHAHGTDIPAIITESGTTPGEYTIDRINTFMPGIWEETLKAIPAGGTMADQDSVLFSFCIEE